MAYFTFFDSYVESLEKKQSFSIVVTLDNGDVVRSSPIPIKFYETVSDHIMGQFSQDVAIHIWNHDMIKTISAIPVTRIRCIDYLLA